MNSGENDHESSDRSRRNPREILRNFLWRLIGTEDETWLKFRARLEQAMAEDQHPGAPQSPLDMMSGATRAARDMTLAAFQQLFPAMLLPQHGVPDAELRDRDHFIVEPGHLHTHGNRVVILPPGWGYKPAGAHSDEVRILNPENQPVFGVTYGPGAGLVRRILPPLELSGDDQ